MGDETVDGLDMFPELLYPYLATWRGAGDRLEEDFGASKSEFGTFEAGFGGGPLGAAFNGVYRPDADAKMAAADKVPLAYTNTAAIGEKCVADYLEGEDRARRGFLFDDTPNSGI